MNLNNFESYIDKKILGRGYDYYENGYVNSVKETNENQFEAEVQGTDFYTVQIELDVKHNIIYTDCDCPYDMGEYCKHQAAVFYTLRDIKNEPAKDSDLTVNFTSFTDKNKKTAGLKKILSDMKKEDLVDILLNIASEYKEIKEQLELNFNDENN